MHVIVFVSAVHAPVYVYQEVKDHIPLPLVNKINSKKKGEEFVLIVPFERTFI